MQSAAGRVLAVRRGPNPVGSSAVTSHPKLGAGEVFVQVQAAALTITDALLCFDASTLSAAQQELLPLAEGQESVVPGFFFCGEVLSLGPFVDGIRVGEPVLGILDAAAWQGQRDDDADPQLTPAEKVLRQGGAFREAAVVQFSSLWPAADLVSAGLRLPAVISLLPGMLNALFTAASRLQLQADEALLVLAPNLSGIVLLLQRLLLLRHSWWGPLYLIVQHGPKPTLEDLGRQSSLRGLLGEGFAGSFEGWSVEEAGGAGGALGSLLEEVSRRTQGAGIDAILSLGLDLNPAQPVSSASGKELPPSELLATLPNEVPLLRSLIKLMALRGRLLVDDPRLELMPADGQHLWAKEATVSFLNVHRMLLSGANLGLLMRGIAEVTRDLLDLSAPCLASSEVRQFRMFEQFQMALEALVGSNASFKDLESAAATSFRPC
eukprot:CAMPEP_0206535994 /NCGR_PEP_ID=MMETSP0325_2-20121206/6479_1 /ASSEMBLY_ACC=CAM_ASM_000347 /TAXON_ID=2866 /ORGANISM="Crypthecodinium cohnii, Strain Seligo" /LENGTH=435 /DNA_ID=CAMNT_0054033109 /DNA_START=9 /DNA_END=1313 /DNA_ORIENTATION=+